MQIKKMLFLTLKNPFSIELFYVVLSGYLAVLEHAVVGPPPDHGRHLPPLPDPGSECVRWAGGHDLPYPGVTLRIVAARKLAHKPNDNTT